MSNKVVSISNRRLTKKNRKKRTPSSNVWLQRQMQDFYSNSARKEGYVARSAYKLIEINKKFHILNNVNSIIDLGCAPGGWLQIIMQSKIPNVVGIDILDIKIPKDKNKFSFICGDFTDPQIQENISDKFDVIVSDLAPSLSGNREDDHLSVINLAEGVLLFCETFLKNNGKVVIKLFQGEDDQKFIKKMRTSFKEVKSFKPLSSRKDSSELYIIGINYSKI